MFVEFLNMACFKLPGAHFQSSIDIQQQQYINEYI